MIHKMKAWACRWLVFLTITIDFSCSTKLFETSDTHLTAKEGSCIKINCTGAKMTENEENAVWYWIKEPKYHPANKTFTGTIIYSNTSKYRVSQDFEGRVEYLGSPSFGRKSQTPCGIRINNLQKTDSGNYAFRFEGTQTWMTNPEVNLVVEENPCKITFEEPPIMKESDVITLQCSTPSSCHSCPEIKELKQSHQSHCDKSLKLTRVSFTADWMDDGRVFTCQMPDNNDKCPAQNVPLTVEYSPRNTVVRKSPEDVKEGDAVTLTCSTRGRPDPTFSWFKDGNEVLVTEAEWKINSISVSDNGTYRCEAKNKYGSNTSATINIDVKYPPSGVTVEMNNPFEITEGDDIMLTCAVSRSNPEPDSFRWYQNSNMVGQEKKYEVKKIQPEKSGSYTCEATNSVDTATSQQYQIHVQYTPRNIVVSRTDIGGDRVKVMQSLTLTCNTEAHPQPHTYSWYHHSDLKLTHSLRTLHFDRVARADDGCYMCSATNKIGQGANSSSFCIKVLYPPTKLTLSMVPEATEGQSITISCTAESFPQSEFTLTQIKSEPRSSSRLHSKSDSSLPNAIQVSFTVTPAHAGLYRCAARNSEGSDSIEKKLVVTFRPKNVAVTSPAGTDGTNVSENADLMLRCEAQSNPPVMSYTWKKTEAGTDELVGQNQILTLRSVTPSHSGLYSCTASNVIGTGKSQQFEVKVMYAPKDIKIDISQLDWKSPAMLSCRSHSFPAVSQYTWYRITEEESDKTIVSSGQNYTVYPDRPGAYYCIASNKMGGKRSEPLRLFLDRGFMHFLPFILTFLFGLFAVVLIVFVCRQRRNKSFQQGTSNTQPCWSRFGFLGWRDGTRENLVNENGFVGPSRSRDDLLPGRPYRPQPQPCRPRPDSTPASNINTVYCTVNLPKGKQGQPQPTRRQDGPTEDDAVNYASLHFGEQQKNRRAPKAKVGEEDVYAKVVKPKPRKKDEQGKQELYENISKARAQKQPMPSNSDSDTSEEDVELNYSVVSFKAKSGNQSGHHSRTKGYSSSDEEDKTQYSEVKI